MEEPYEAARALRIGAGAPWFTKPGDLNVFGVRRYPGTVDLFDDIVVCARLVKVSTTRTAADVRVYPATTDPGRAYLLRPMRARGTAILAPGHYPRSHGLGFHKGYPALVQVGPLVVYRDADKDADFDLDPRTRETAEGTGINIHAAADDEAGPSSEAVGRWSAGCQVLRRRSDLRDLVRRVEEQRAAGWGWTISYTLVDERSVPAGVMAALRGMLDP